jgi:hypothetical protein
MAGTSCSRNCFVLLLALLLLLPASLYAVKCIDLDCRSILLTLLLLLLLLAAAPAAAVVTCAGHEWH